MSSESFKLAWRVVRYRYAHQQGPRRPTEQHIRGVAEFIQQLLDLKALEALPPGASSSYWDTWHEPSDLPRVRIN
jgi:hypothetical protein